MKYKIESKEDELHIEVVGSEGKQQELLQAFGECQQGRCSCPSKEYSKLDALEIENDKDTIRLKLKAKADEVIDQAEISKCLEYTRSRVMDES